MKNLRPLATKSLLILVLTFFASQNHANPRVQPDPNPKSTLQFSIAIPDNLKSSVIREDDDGMTVFKFSNGNETPVFLFSITKVTERDWMVLKDQMPDAKIIAHKDDAIYFTQKTNQSTIKGSNGDLYRLIYFDIDNMIGSIQISD